MSYSRVWLAVLLWTAATTSSPAHADDYAFGFNPRTGDAWFDARLGEINIFADGNLDGYVHDVVLTTGAPRLFIETLVIEQRYPPADVWMIAETARVSGYPLERVRQEFDQSRGRGWGVIARNLGIKPGSSEFHALKRGAGVWEGKGKGKAKHNEKHTPAANAATGKSQHPHGHPAAGKGKDKSHGKGKHKD